MEIESIADALGAIIEQAETMHGSFEIRENIEAAKAGALGALLDTLIQTYLDSFTPEERAERKRLAETKPVGFLKAPDMFDILE